MVPTFAELEEPNIAIVWREIETVVVSHGLVPELIGGDKGELSIIPPTLEPLCLTFKVEVRKQLASLLRALGEHLDIITDVWMEYVMLRIKKPA